MIAIDMDMPKGCDDCIFSTHCHDCEGFMDRCVLAGREFPLEDGRYRTAFPKERPYWCPLKEIPMITLRKVKVNDEFQIDMRMKIGFTDPPVTSG